MPFKLAIYHARLMSESIDQTRNKQLIQLAKLLKRVNIYGQEVDENTTGIIILIYDNGQTKKIIK